MTTSGAFLAYCVARLVLSFRPRIRTRRDADVVHASTGAGVLAPRSVMVCQLVMSLVMGYMLLSLV